MIHQDENMGFMDQLEDALSFLVQNEEMTQEELDLINLRIKSYEEELDIIKKDISSILQNNSTTDLFSPNTKDINNSSLNSLRDKKSEIEKKIKNEEENFLLCIKRKNSYDNLLNCFYTLKSNSIEDPHTVKEQSNYLIENKISLDMGIKVLEAQENERKRIARDLHDSTVQNLTNMMHKTELCTRLIDLDSIRAKLELQTMISTIKTTINDMRSIIFGLRPMSLDDLGLIATIERYVRDINKCRDINISLNVHNEETRVLPVINLTLFRIIQEACNNAMKHGKATDIVVDVLYDTNFINLSIKDNGLGFKQETLLETRANIYSGYGLSMMKERVFILSGNFEIDSKENEGTNIKVKIPIKHSRRA